MVTTPTISLARLEPWLKARLGLDRKASVLLGLALVLVGIWAWKWMGGNTTPAASLAANAKASNSTLMSDSAGRTGQAPTEKAVERAMKQWMSAPVGSPGRNLFVVRREYFPIDATRTDRTALPDPGSGFWTMLEKSMSARVDEKQKRENMIANFKAEAARLRLEAIVWGDSPKALVNGEFVGEGNVVASFRVLRIEPRRIIVEREGIRLEIQMN